MIIVDNSLLRVVVACVAALVVGSLLLLGIRFVLRLPHSRRRGAVRLVVPPAVLGAFGLAGVIGGNGWALYVSLGAPGGPPLSRLILYLVSMSAVFVAIIWTGYVQHRLAEEDEMAHRTTTRPANMPRDPAERERDTR